MREELVVSVSGLCKSFDIYDNPADRVKEIFSLRRKKYSTNFIALEDVDFSIRRGEFVGLIGRNGAGKSTLLKILSGQLTATDGVVSVQGTISLLRLGVGFNRELSGVENIRFSARLLGHDEENIARIIQEVVDFADLGEFIYHPVKTYSSGMYSRLAFSIGITVNPDILIVDEVLSVGDMRFASKCLGRMHELKEMGKTVILVSHDIEKVAVFCNRAIWLQNGRVQMDGPAKDVVDCYRDFMLSGSKISDSLSSNESVKPFGYPSSIRQGKPVSEKDIIWNEIEVQPSIDTGSVRILHSALLDKDTMKAANAYVRRDVMLLYLKILARVDIEELVVGWNLVDKNGLIAAHSGSNYIGNNVRDISGGSEVTCCFSITVPPIRNGDYLFTVGVRIGERIVYKVNNIIPVTINNDDMNSRQGGYIIIDEMDFTYSSTH